jgi:transcriptional regulator of acetoin/glycerol metabolism
MENVIERVRLLAAGPSIKESDIRQELISGGRVIDNKPHIDVLEVSEKQKIERILQEEKYNYTQAAKKIGISRTTLWRKLREWDRVH